MDPYLKDITRGVVGVAWGDAHPNDKRTAQRHRVSRRTATRWRNEGPPWLRDTCMRIALSENPYRLAACLWVTIKQAFLAKLGNTDLVERYRQIRRVEIVAECEDRQMEYTAHSPWLDRAMTAERDAAINAEKAACYREFARRRMTEEEVRDD